MNVLFIVFDEIGWYFENMCLFSFEQIN